MHNDNQLQQDHEELQQLCRKLLNGAQACSGAPHFILQPFLGIVRAHADIINRLGLNQEKAPAPAKAYSGEDCQL